MPKIIIIFAIFAASTNAEITYQPLGAVANNLTTKSIWNLSIGRDGANLPAGSGDATAGSLIFAEKCSICHGNAGIGASADALVGEVGSLKSKYPEKTVNSYWPYAPTLFDYIRRAMPINAPFSLTNDEVYSLSAYILSQDAVIPADLVLNKKTLSQIKMPNRYGFKAVYTLQNLIK